LSDRFCQADFKICQRRVLGLAHFIETQECERVAKQSEQGGVFHRDTSTYNSPEKAWEATNNVWSRSNFKGLKCLIPLDVSRRLLSIFLELKIANRLGEFEFQFIDGPNLGLKRRVTQYD
jgi:hypothetical protein